MATYQGVIAGVGDKANGINVISPEFDARIRHFIVGKDCIVEGMALEGNILTAGACIAQGYVGYLENDIVLETPNAAVYGVFHINHSNEIDTFEITDGNYVRQVSESKTFIYNAPQTFEMQLSVPSGTQMMGYSLTLNGRTYTDNATDSYFAVEIMESVLPQGSIIARFTPETLTPLGNINATLTLTHTEEIQQNDILHGAGAYYLKIYENGVLQIEKNYPENAVNSDNTNHIFDGGTIGDGVTAVTQPNDDFSQKVATTAFVHNVIAARTIDETYTYTKSSGGTTATITIRVIGKRKAGLCVLDTVQIDSWKTSQNAVDVGAGTVLAEIEDDLFIPQKTITIGTIYNGDVLFQLNTKGEIFTYGKGFNVPFNEEPTISIMNDIGYETK